MNLNNVKLGYSPVTDGTYLYHHGKDPNLALDKQDIELEVMAVLVEHMMYNAPKGSKKTVKFGDREYLVKVTPLQLTDD